MKRPRTAAPRAVPIPHPGERFEQTGVSYTFELERPTPALRSLEQGAEVFGAISRGGARCVLICGERGALGVAPAAMTEVIIAAVDAIGAEGRLAGRVAGKGGDTATVEIEFMTRHVTDEAELITLRGPEGEADAGQLRRARASLMRVYERFMSGEGAAPFELRPRAGGGADLVLSTPRSFRPAATMLIAWPHPAAEEAVRRRRAAAAA